VTGIELAIFIKRVEAICMEMGIVLRQAAFSPNIKDRLDFSCALFDHRGGLFAQAAHIPVHLGSMAFATEDIVSSVTWNEGDVMVLNDPYLGGTHLPDITLISPLFVRVDGENELLGFVANRAHHANVGAISPGSMPISRTLDEEGVIIPPTFLWRAGELNIEAQKQLTDLGGTDVVGDFAAQRSANKVGLERLTDLLTAMGIEEFTRGVEEVNDY
jgi:N-methylhydantoinase B